MKVDLRLKLTDDEQAHWNRFWQESAHTHPKNHLLFAEVERAMGRTPVYAIGKIDDKVVCAGLFSMRPLLGNGRYSLEAYCQRGPVFDDTRHARIFLPEVVRQFKALKAGAVRISPYWSYPEAVEVESLLRELEFSPYNNGSMSRTSTGIVDLRGSLDEIFASLKGKTRQEIRRAEKLGVVIRPATSIEEAEPFYRCLSELHRQRSLFAITRVEFEAMCKLIFGEKELGILLNAFYDSTFLGGLWVVRGPKVSFHSRFVVEKKTLAALSNLTIGPVLWWEAIKWAKGKGCSLLNVEGYRSEADESDPKYYTYRVKKKFNPALIEILSEYERPCSREIYLIYKIWEFFRRCVNYAGGLPYKIKLRWQMRNLRHSVTEEDSQSREDSNQSCVLKEPVKA